MYRRLYAFVLVMVLASVGPARADAPFMVSAPHPLATQAGIDVLAKGGTAADAMVAVQTMLTLVTPQSTGLAGGGFLLYWDAEAGALHVYDGRETAPASADAARFLDKDGTPLKLYDAVVGGLSVGVPGIPRLMHLAHERHGQLLWADLLAPTAQLAREGFPVSARLHSMVGYFTRLKTMPATRAYFFTEDGEPLPTGHILKNPTFADVVDALAAEGSDAFHTGTVAELLVKAVQNPAPRSGDLTLDDMASYQVKLRDPVCGAYRGYRVCGMGPPSSGGIAVAQILGMLARFDLGDDPNSVRVAHLIAEASRLAFADRALYVADPEFVAVPTAGLVDPAYVAARGALIDPAKSMGTATPGAPPGSESTDLAPAVDGGWPSTAHMSIVDGYGNWLSLTSSVEFPFGAHVMAGGMILNNQLTDFAFTPSADGKPVANRVEPGKRPRSSMSPTIVFDSDGKPVVAVGSAGGARIIGHVVRAITGVLDFGLSPQEAVSLPHVANRNGITELEAGTVLADLKPTLEALGHEVKVTPFTSGLQMIALTADGLQGGSDPRREGTHLAGP